MRTELLIIGAGGHGRVVADAALGQGAWGRLWATDRDPAKCQGVLLAGVELVSLDQGFITAMQVHIAIGHNSHRAKEFGIAKAKWGEACLAAVLHPRASVSGFASFGAATFIAAQAVVAAGSGVGKGCIINHGAVVDHDVRMGDFCHIAPRVTLGGAVVVGSRVLIGSGAVVLPGLVIGDDVVIGAGAVVCRDLLTAGTYVGVPARQLTPI